MGVIRGPNWASRNMQSREKRSSGLTLACGLRLAGPCRCRWSWDDSGQSQPDVVTSGGELPTLHGCWTALNSEEHSQYSVRDAVVQGIRFPFHHDLALVLVSNCHATHDEVGHRMR